MFMQGWTWIHIPGAFKVKGVKHAMSMPVPWFFGKSTKKQSAHPRNVSQNSHRGFLLTPNTLWLPMFQLMLLWFMSLWGRKMGKPDTIIIYIEEILINRVPKSALTHSWPNSLMWQKHKRTASLLASLHNPVWPVSLTRLIRSVLA